MKNFGIILAITFVIQILFINLFSINGVRPDFLIIFILYFAVNFGSFRGTIAGFTIGILAGLFNNGLSTGVLPLIYSIVGYTSGFLKSSTL